MNAMKQGAGSSLQEAGPMKVEWKICRHITGRSYHLMKPGSKFTPAIDRRDYSDLKGETSFWVSGSYNGSGANYVFINCDNKVEIKYQTNSYTNSGTNETYIDYWYSVRCIQDN